MNYFDPRIDAKLIKDWVVIGHDNTVTYYETFDEALHGPNGHLMSKQYYDHHWKDINTSK
jgi:hypothetical protein